jgi:flagellar export protein FliJ
MTATPLRRLVRYRERLERLQEQQLGAALRRERERADALAEAEAGRASLLGQAPAYEPADGESRLAYLQRAEREITARTAALAHSHESVAREREALLEQRRDRKAMEALLDRTLAEERLDQQRADRKQLDSVAGRAWFDRLMKEGERDGR